ncbi:MAG TPA: threonine/serine dehydratase [Thermodesulfobacteriota bacterium]
MVDRDAIDAAAHRIAGRVRETPVIALEGGALGAAAPLVLKLESLQHTGSFKPRGALNRILSAEVPAAGVIAASGGNHGAAVAWAARVLGHRAEIFVPEVASPVKVERLRRYGAAVTVTGATYADAKAASDRRAAESGALVVHAYDQPEVVAGQGTLFRELDRQAGGLDTVVVAVGGGGLVAGAAAWFAGRVRVIGVEPVRAPTLHAALAVGRPVDVEVGGIAADSLGARRVGDLAFALARAHVERVVLVDDEAIRAAQRALWEALRVVAEPGGAAALAAVTSGAYRPGAGERVAVLVCGGNTDPASVA